MNAIDTNILAYAIDGSEPRRSSAALALLDRLSADDTVLLWQVACELGSVVTKVRRRGGTSLEPASVLASFRARFPLAVPEEQVLDGAFDLQGRYNLSYWDSLLIAACISAGVDTLFTEDLAAGTTIAGVHIVNPFEA